MVPRYSVHLPAPRPPSPDRGRPSDRTGRRARCIIDESGIEIRIADARAGRAAGRPVSSGAPGRQCRPQPSRAWQQPGRAAGRNVHAWLCARDTGSVTLAGPSDAQRPGNRAPGHQM